MALEREAGAPDATVEPREVKVVLDEEITGFGYGYRMRCACTAAIELSQEQYRRQSVGSPTVCEHCSARKHFGPYDVMLRDTADSALADDHVQQRAWYHTSTHRDWPPAALSAPSVEDDAEHRSFEPLKPKALHVGTYEAAIENMLRHMNETAEVGVVFYLHRVQVTLRPGDIEAGYRDEINQIAAQITLEQLENDDLLALRYLNVHESWGSLSLAIDPAVIEAVQTLQLPIPALTPPPEGEHLERLRQLDAVAAAAAAADSPTALDKLIAKHDARRPVDQAPPPKPRYQPSSDGLDYMAETYLTGVGSVVREEFCRGLTEGAKDITDPADLYRQFVAFSVLLTQPDAVVALLQQQPVRQGAGMKLVRERRSIRHR
ncbi:hypothetical protein [Nocardia salmonicida]|uniref:hypothetical protein n=1 Tax=Nocardia salmonicida TaxID=53431 RepID=UPI0037BB6871